MAHLGEHQEAMMWYEMLVILRSIATHRDFALTLEQWRAKYRGVVLDCGWSEIDEWLANMNQSDTKAKLIEAVGVFKSH